MISEPYLYIHRLHNISYFRAIGLLKLNLNFRLVDKIFLDVASLSLLVHHYQGVYPVHVYLNEVNFINDDFSVLNFQC